MTTTRIGANQTCGLAGRDDITAEELARSLAVRKTWLSQPDGRAGFVNGDDTDSIAVAVLVESTIGDGEDTRQVCEVHSLIGDEDDRPIALATYVGSEDWEPQVYADALRAAGWVPITGWAEAMHGLTCLVQGATGP